MSPGQATLYSGHTPAPGGVLRGFQPRGEEPGQGLPGVSGQYNAGVLSAD